MNCNLRTCGLLITLLLVALSATACGDAESTDSALVVVATTSVLGDVAAQVVGDNGTVEVIVPIGADPHDYQPSAQQIALAERAGLVVANGLGLETGLLDVLDATAGDGANVLEVGPLLDPIPFGEHSEEDHDDGDDHADGDEGHEHANGLDPHVWLDPLRMADAARLIAAELDVLDNTVDWAASAAAYADELMAADEEIKTILDGIPDDRRSLVTNHDALGYFADRYGFAVVGTVIPGGSTLAEPSSAELAALVDTIDATGVPAIFADTTSPSALAEAVAAEAGRNVAVVELFTGSLGPPGSGADTLVDMLVTNATRVAEGLG